MGFEDYFSDKFPMVLIKIIQSYICNCELKTCSFCEGEIFLCYITYCAKCKRKTCNSKKCPVFPVDIVLQYDAHKELKACKECIYCRDYNNFNI